MDCHRCLGPIFPSQWIPEVQQVFVNNLHLTCAYCLSDTNDATILHIDDKLKVSRATDGWQEVLKPEHRLAFFVLTQMNHLKFDLPDPEDIVRILFKDEQAIGFYSLKPKGLLILPTMETYSMNTLDTAFILPKYRRQGFGLSVFMDIVNQFSENDIGVSAPISFNMLCVVKKLLALFPAYKTRLWEINGAGGEGSKKLLHYIVNKKDT